MKRKVFQFLMMMTVTVSLGVFVSCKDTNEDLISELKIKLQEVAADASLTEALQTQVDNLQLQLNTYRDMLTAIKSCNCPDDMSSIIQNLTTQLNTLQAFYDAMQAAGITPSSYATMQQDMGQLQQQIQTVINQVTNNYQEIITIVNNPETGTQALDSAIKVIEARLDSVQKCGCDLSKYATLEQLAAVDKTAADAYALADAASKQIKSALDAAAAAQAAADSAATAAAAAAATAEQAAKDAADAKGVAEAAKKVAEAADSLANSVKSIADAAKALAETNKENIQKNADAISKMQIQMVAFSDSLKHAYETADQAAAQALINKTAIEKLDSTVKAHKSILDNVTDVTIPGMEKDITTLFNKVDSLGTEITSLKDSIVAVKAYADAKLLEAKAYTDLQVAAVTAKIATVDGRVDSLGNVVTNVNTTVTNLTNTVNNLGDKLDSLADVVDTEVTDIWVEINKLQNKDNEISETLQAYKDSTDQKIIDAMKEILTVQKAVEEINDSLGKLDARIDANTVKIGEVEEKVDSIAESLSDRIDNLQKEVNDLADRVKKNEDDIADLYGELDKLREDLARQVTGIIVQGTNNPAFGTFAIPAGIQSNVLIAYYGEAYQDVYFPTSRTANYVEDKYALTSKDMEVLGLSDTPLFKSGEKIMQNDIYNAGALYLTVNPNTVDFSHLKLSLVNSQDKESYVKLGQLVRSDKTLELGFSRAANNGFYECAANVSQDDVYKVQKVDFNASAIKADIKEIMDKRLDANFKGMASDVVDLIKGLRLDANAVKCEWEDTEGQKHAVYSNYNIAATAIKPLPLTFMKDANYKTVPGYERAMSLLNRLSTEVKDRVKVVFKEFNGSALVEKIADLKIDSIKVDSLSDKLLANFIVSMDTTIWIDGLSYHMEYTDSVDVPVKFSKDLEIPVNLNGINVTVPLNIQKDVEVDLSKVNVTTPTVVVTGKVNGTASTTDDEGNPQSILFVPVKNDNGDIVGYTEIPLNEIDVKADFTADGGFKDGETITLNGKPVATVVIDTTINTEVDIHDKVKYTLVVDERVKAAVNLDKWFYFGDNGTDKKSFRIHITYDMRKAAKDLWGEAQTAIGSVNGMLADISDIVDEVNKLIDKINGYEKQINSQVDKYIDKIAGYIEKANKKIVDFVNNTNSRVQPVMVATDATGTKTLSEAKNYPTVMGSDIILVPTTWTVELLVPIAKKHIAVTNVFDGTKSAQGGDTDCLNELKRVNGSPTLNTVLSGELRRASASGMKSGYVYEFAYSALDFHGKIATRKYYIKVK